MYTYVRGKTYNIYCVQYIVNINFVAKFIINANNKYKYNIMNNDNLESLPHISKMSFYL